MGLRKLVKHVRDVMLAVLAGDGELAGIVLSAQHVGRDWMRTSAPSGTSASMTIFSPAATICLSSSLVPHASVRPLSMIMMRVQISSTSSI